MLLILDDTQMRVLIGYKPTSLGQRRVHLAALLALDTGLRVSEVLHLRTADVDFDNLILKVFGKGQKERFVPFSPDLRKRLYRFEQFKEKKGIRTLNVFGVPCGTGLPRPPQPKAPLVPGVDGLRLDDHERRSPAGPDAGEPPPEPTVRFCEPQPSWPRAMQHLQLVPQAEHFELECSA